MAVYFILNPDAGIIKIGYSFNVPKRIKALKEQHGAPLVLLGVIAGGQAEEQKLHEMFDESRMTGEWFHSNYGLLQFVDRKTTTLDALAESAPVSKFSLRSKISILAQERGFNTAEALSKKTGLTCSTVRNVWEGDISNRQFGTLYAIARVLNVEMSKLAELGEDAMTEEGSQCSRTTRQD